MFTGIITDVGTIDSAAETAAGREFRVACAWSGLEAGESIALNGACLTVRECGDRWFSVAAVVTTLGRTTIDRWTRGTRVNLERAVRASDRLGGHIVQGHVDAVAEVTGVRQSGDARLVEIALPTALWPLVIPHGSIAVDGVSLTVNALVEPSTVELSLIEYTLRHTTLGELAPGHRVHVEADVIGKYVQRLHGMAPLASYTT